MMKFVCLLLLFVATSAFRVQPFHGKFRISHGTVLKMSSEKPKYDIVPLDKVNIENASAVTGGILGLVLGGPVFALFLAAITNYVAKKENDSGEAIRGLGKTVIESYNYLNKINTKYLLTDKITGTVTKAVSSADADSEAVETVKKAYTTTTSKLAELNKQYDLTSKGKELLVAAGTLSDAALDKLVDLNKKYDFVATTKNATSAAVDKLKEQTGAVPPTTTPSASTSASKPTTSAPSTSSSSSSEK